MLVHLQKLSATTLKLRAGIQASDDAAPVRVALCGATTQNAKLKWKMSE